MRIYPRMHILYYPKTPNNHILFVFIEKEKKIKLKQIGKSFAEVEN